MILFVEGDAHSSGGGKCTARGGGGSGVVDGLGGVVCAVSTIEDPVVVGAAGRSASGTVVSVLVHFEQSLAWVAIGVESGVSGVSVDVDAEAVFVDSGHPVLYFRGGVGWVDVEGSGGVAEVEEGSCVGVKCADSLHFVGNGKLGGYAAIAVEACADFVKEPGEGGGG